MVTRVRMRTVTNLLLLNLAAADLAFVLVIPPFTAYEYVAGELPTSSWALGGTICKLLHYLVNVTAYVTVYTLVLIAAVRYMTIVHGARTAPLRRRSRVVAALAVIWVGMLLVNAPILGAYAVRRVGDADRRDCDLTDQSLGRPMHHAGPASGLRLTGSDLDPDSNTPTLGRPTTPDAGWTPSRIRTPTHSWGPIYKISYDYRKFVVR